MSSLVDGMSAERSTRLPLLARRSLHDLRSIQDKALAIWQKAGAWNFRGRHEYQFGLCLRWRAHASRIGSIACQAAQMYGYISLQFSGSCAIFSVSRELW